MHSPIDTLAYIAAHPLASRRRFSAFCRYGWWQVASRLQNTIEYQWVGGAKLLVKNGMTGATGNIYCGLHEFVDMAFLLHFLRPEDLFVDVGANIGSYATLASVACGASVIAVEPDPDTMQNLRANIEVNRVSGRVELVEAALGAHAGSVKFTTGQDTTNRVATTTDVKTRDVAVRRLDDVLAGRHPQLLKMDVEGYEAEVIVGGIAVLDDPSLQAVITESAGGGVRGPLEARGFREYSYEPFKRELTPKIDARQTAHNSLFIRDALLAKKRIASAPRRRIAGVEL